MSIPAVHSAPLSSRQLARQCPRVLVLSACPSTHNLRGAPHACSGQPAHLPNLEPSVATPSVVAAALVMSSRFCDLCKIARAVMA